ncbi:hypothetical protein NNO_1508 [Hydrogenimonas sp.]|nr:hypothetical protein NNO_1508 [Hydrogenimonas sp.]
MSKFSVQQEILEIILKIRKNGSTTTTNKEIYEKLTQKYGRKLTRAEKISVNRRLDELTELYILAKNDTVTGEYFIQIEEPQKDDYEKFVLISLAAIASNKEARQETDTSYVDWALDRIAGTSLIECEEMHVEGMGKLLFTSISAGEFYRNLPWIKVKHMYEKLKDEKNHEHVRKFAKYLKNACPKLFDEEISTNRDKERYECMKKLKKQGIPMSDHIIEELKRFL